MEGLIILIIVLAAALVWATIRYQNLCEVHEAIIAQRNELRVKVRHLEDRQEHLLKLAAKTKYLMAENEKLQAKLYEANPFLRPNNCVPPANIPE